MPKTNVDRVRTQYRRFNDLLRGEMKRQKVTQTTLADYLGTTQATLSFRINGKSEWLFLDVLKAVELLGIDINQIF